MVSKTLLLMHILWFNFQYLCCKPDWEAAVILEVEPKYVRRKVFQVIWIRNTLDVCNLDCMLYGY